MGQYTRGAGFQTGWSDGPWKFSAWIGDTGKTPGSRREKRLPNQPIERNVGKWFNVSAPHQAEQIRYAREWAHTCHLASIPDGQKRGGWGARKGQTQILISSTGVRLNHHSPCLPGPCGAWPTQPNHATTPGRSGGAHEPNICAQWWCMQVGNSGASSCPDRSPVRHGRRLPWVSICRQPCVLDRLASCIRQGGRGRQPGTGVYLCLFWDSGYQRMGGYIGRESHELPSLLYSLFYLLARITARHYCVSGDGL